MLEIAFNGEVTPNKKLKHEIDGANGWYHYESRFGLSVYSENGEVERYNVFHVYMIVRHDKNGRKYLYDIINIKKETSTPLKIGRAHGLNSSHANESRMPSSA